MLGVAALRADVHCHILNDAQNGHAHLFKHLDAFFGVQQGDVLGCGDDDRARHGHALRQRELNVAGAGRHVDDQVVQVFPVGLAQQLLQRLGGHGAAPDHGFVLRHQKTDGHDLQAVVLHRLHVLAVHALGPAFDAHHHGLAGAVNVGVQQADAGAFSGQGQGQVDRGGAFANAALARGDSDDVLDVGQQLHAALHAVAGDFDRDIDRHIGHARHRLDGGNQRFAQAGQLAFGGVAQLDIKSHIAVGDSQVFDGFGTDEVFARVGVNDGL